MLFNSLAYAIFLPVVFVLYWVLPHKLRWPLLLAASYYFYMSWNVKYVVLIVITTLVSYTCAIYIEKTERKRNKKLAIAAALIVSLGILYVFKYFNFSADLLKRFAALNIPHLQLLLPVGISFYTFQTLGYVIDVYRGDIKAERNLGVYATFVSFFPQLVAGPIERTKNLMPQITSEKHFDYNSAAYGVRLILWGLYKKMVIADNLALYVDKVYGDIHSYSGYSILLATFFFSLQIYCDFSGYSDIARGSAKMLNINLMENFKSPYFSASIKEFWSRWHISLSTWFRDYLYIPLGGSRVSKPRTAFNKMVTFLVSGLWHGANMTFVIWGGIHGAAQVGEDIIKPNKNQKHNAVWFIRVIVVFVFVMAGWIFFRAETFRDALYALTNIFSGITHAGTYFSAGKAALELDTKLIIRTILLYIAPLTIYDFISLKTDICEWIGRRKGIVRFAYMFLLTVIILIFGYVGQSTFVYFQF